MSADRIEVACPHCGQRTAVAPANLGRKGRCPGCKEVFELRAPVRAKPAPEADELFGDLPGLGPPPSAGANGLWNDFSQPTAARPTEDEFRPAPLAAPVRAPNMADDYLRRAKEDKPTVQSMEAEPWYRFTTSYGSVIGGALMFLAGVLVFLAISFRLGIVMVIAGGGWFIQGMNYVFYYRWQDEQGR